MHSLGVKMGYFLPERKLPNPIDIILVFAQQVRTALDVCYHGYTVYYSL